jgi:hypothetical protein
VPVSRNNKADALVAQLDEVLYGHCLIEATGVTVL